MKIEIQNTEQENVKFIFRLYDEATAYQKKVGNNHWQGFDPELIAREIEEQRHFKVLGDGEIIATFCITLNDPLIWKDSAETPAVYIHRIATSKKVRGQRLLEHIVDWVKVYAAIHELQYVRLDTGEGNDPLINYYISHGFSFLGNITVDYTPDLPAHYKDGKFALLQMIIN